MRRMAGGISRLLVLVFLLNWGCAKVVAVKTAPPPLMAPQLAEVFTRNAEEFDSSYGNQTVELVGLIRNRLEETPSTGKRYLVLWGYENPANKSETVVRCEYIPDFETILPKGRVKIRGKVLPYRESNQGVTVVECAFLGFRKPYGEKNTDPQNKNDMNLSSDD